MAAYAEGLNILHNANVGTREQTTDVETAPLRYPLAYAYDIDVAKVSEVWRRGSVVAVVVARPHRGRVSRSHRSSRHCAG